jgi:ketosteroid isomerase-like protein
MTRILWIGGLLSLAAIAFPANPPPTGPAEEIIALERAALDRWGRGDPEGFLGTYAPEGTYFDPSTPKRMNGLAAMRERYGPIKGKVKVNSYDMIDPKVQGHGDVRVLSYNLVSRSPAPAGDSVITTRWNSSSVYERVGGGWKVLHSHWSFTVPPTDGGARRP